MYQSYYSHNPISFKNERFSKNIWDIITVTAIRPTMWEEHCLECSAPVCYNECIHYEARSDGRCKRFDDGLGVFNDERACCDEGAHVKFRVWSNMLSLVFPRMLSVDKYRRLHKINWKYTKLLKKIESSSLSQKNRWSIIRGLEYIRRKALRIPRGTDNFPDAFIFHAYSYNSENYNIIVEVFVDHTSRGRFSIPVQQGENLKIVSASTISPAFSDPNGILKVYAENDIPAELDILWCDFVKGEFVSREASDKKVKCVVWDLDNTIWSGTLIETEDLDDLHLNADVLETIKALDERGILQSISSKNDYDPAMAVLQKLGIAEYFLYPQISWNPKSEAISIIAHRLNIGSDSFAFIDDSRFEREEVKTRHPEVRVYDQVEVRALLNKEEFEVDVTEESTKRREMYRIEGKRNDKLAQSGGDLLSFLYSCHLTITVFTPSTEQDINRCYELVVRTNQLNMTGIKYTKPEFLDVLNKSNRINCAFSCEDDFGSYGIVGYVQYEVVDSKLVFTEFAMSCRVAGKFVESVLFEELLKKENCTSGVFDVIITKKNALLRRTLENIGFAICRESDSNITYEYTDNLKNSDVVSLIWRE